jgi:hypothetical protein
MLRIVLKQFSSVQVTTNCQIEEKSKIKHESSSYENDITSIAIN